ncbi:MAG: RNA pseudouridine synthase [Treponema bryantii]|nr:RNA pseudouridine synthase [Treponema bryantii]
MNIKMTNKIEFLNTPSKENPFLVISKPSGLPTAPLSAQDTNNALYLAAQTFPEIFSVNGKKEIEHGLIHRIDTVTEGLILIATTQDAYENFINQQKNNNFTKFYTAICQKNQNKKEGFPDFPKPNIFYQSEFQIQSYFRYFGPCRKEVRPVPIENLNKTQQKKVEGTSIYTTNVKIISEQNDTVKVECNITKGFKHQVRCHLAWANLPIKNDPVYNQNAEKSEQIKFYASKLQFLHPVTNQIITFQKDY